MGKAGDAESAAAFTRENAAHLARFSPERPPEETTQSFWRERFEKDLSEFLSDASCRMLLFPSGDERVIGSVNLFAFVRGSFQACILGYGLAASEQGKGLMTEALDLVIGFAIDELGFHRLAANVHPDNARSRALLRRHGFVEEGLAEEYVLVRGTWVPHVLYAKTDPHWRPSIG